MRIKLNSRLGCTLEIPNRELMISPGIRLEVSTINVHVKEVPPARLSFDVSLFIMPALLVGEILRGVGLVETGFGGA